MTTQTPWFEEIVMPALLRQARVTYGEAMRWALEKAGYDDVPKNGLYVIGGLALGAGAVPLSQVVKALGVSKQSAGQLVDALVLRGYLDRKVDDEDRRKLTVKLTERGRAAAAAQAEARKKIDAMLVARVGEENVSRTRRTLAALVDMGLRSDDDQHDKRLRP
jgi:DNA-binding MarR family transcriptional regulator